MGTPESPDPVYSSAGAVSDPMARLVSRLVAGLVPVNSVNSTQIAMVRLLAAARTFEHVPIAYCLSQVPSSDRCTTRGSASAAGAVIGSR